MLNVRSENRERLIFSLNEVDEEKHDYAIIKEFMQKNQHDFVAVLKDYLQTEDGQTDLQNICFQDGSVSIFLLAVALNDRCLLGWFKETIGVKEFNKQKQEFIKNYPNPYATTPLLTLFGEIEKDGFEDIKIEYLN